MNQPGPHWLRHNASSRMPRRFIYVDTEARRAKAGGVETQSFRLAVAAAEGWNKDAADYTDVEWGDFDTPAALWEWVEKHTSSSYRTIMLAHNLAYDLRIAQTFQHLPAAGWSCDRIRLNTGSAHARWTKGRSTLLMVDLYSWLPKSLAQIGVMVGAGKPDLPDESDDRALWLARCTADVEIMRAAWRRVVDWIGANDLGNWQVTGAGMAWSAWRHRFLTDKLLVGLDEETTNLERAAAHAGRAEAWRHGSFRNRRADEWDYKLTYAHIGRDAELPVRPMGPLRTPPLSRVLATSRSVAWLCDVTVQQDLPVLPAHHGDRTLWPTGEFRTTVWSPELTLAHEEGARITLHAARPYLRKPLLRGFMGWAIEVCDGQHGGDDPVIATMVKHWTRALVGRFGMRFKRWEPAGKTDNPECLLLPGVDIDTGEAYRYLFVGGDVMRESDEVDFPDGSPAVLSYVMALTRVQLWRAMRTAGLDHVIYVDTDSLIVDPKGSRNIAAAVAAGGLPGLRIKSKYQTLEVIGPRQLVVDGKLKVAGLRSNAVQTGPRTWSTEAWRGAAESLKRRESGVVKVVDRKVRLRGATGRRQLLAGGRTDAWRLPGLPPPPSS